MRKSMVLFFGLVVLTTTGTSFAVVMLTELPVTNAGLRNDGGASYHVQGITDDGAYVVASMYDAAAATNHTAYIKVSDGPTGTPTFLTGRQAGGRGIGMTPTGIASASCAEANVPATPLGLSANAGATTTTYLNTANEAQVATFNAMALDPSTGNGWIVGQRLPVKGNQGYAWQVTGGAVNVTPTWNKAGVSGKLGWSGVSTTGIAVGSDSSGPGGVEGPVLANVATNGNAYKMNAFAGSSGRGSGYGISNNAAYSTGYLYAAAGTLDAYHAFRNTVLANTTVELLPAGGDNPLVSQLTAGYDVADDGTVGGFTYNAIGGGGGTIAGYRATIWLPGQNTGVLLQDILAANSVGLGDFSYLERIVSVTNDGKTFAGRGVLTSDGSYRGFVATIPEPASLSLLALGGVALLRRRR